MQESELLRLQSYTDGLRERLIDTARYLRGISAIVEGLNKGAVDSLEVAIHAVEAAAEDLGEVRANVIGEGDPFENRHRQLNGDGVPAGPA